MVKKFLIIDDDQDDKELFCEAIKAIDEEIDCYSETIGRKALEKLNSKKLEKPDVIFMDVNMPLLNGWECLSLLKANQEYKEIPVVVYSTSAETEDVNKARKLGALCYFKKPSDFKGLKESLQVIINHVNGGVLEPSKLISI
jgi:CheY-like chemotaxis protein